MSPPRNAGRHDTAVACFDPECVDEDGNRSVAEPEQDGEHQYHHCTVCGYDFGFRKAVPTAVAVNSDGVCAVGVPEDLRRAASAAMQTAIAQDTGPLLQIGRRPDDPTA